ncbi:hypothetical protein FRC03_011997 [Tulasnella sp. 419]|nr:hypothetical protein FRC03_011997 [Tulasnella sp. 419]
MASKITKRKLDDAIDRLDSVLSPSHDEPSPSKKPNTSIYASLSRYNLFKSSSNTSSRSPPRQSSPAISLPFALSSKPPYRPESTQDFLSRLSTFKLTTYHNKPDSINAVAAAKAGWTNDGKDRLVCRYCNASFVLAPTKGMTTEAANALIERQRQGLVSNHKDFCPWKKAQCDDSVYRIPLQRPTALAKQIRARAELLSPIVRNIAVSHPLTTAELNLLLDTLSALSLIDQKHDDDPSPTDFALNPLSRTSAVQGPDNHATSATNAVPFSETAAILSLFGWETLPAHHMQPPPTPLSRAASVSRATSPAVHSRASTPSPSPRIARLQQRHSTSLSRSSGQNLQSTLQRTSSFTSVSSNNSFQRPSIAPRLSLGDAVPEGEVAPSTPQIPKRNLSGGSSINLDRPVDINAVMWCEMCQRRVGLWTFTASFKPVVASERETTPPSGSQQNPSEPGESSSQAPSPSRQTSASRQLDVVKEHRSFCPYVTKSTSLPAPVFSVPLPASTTGSVSSTKSSRKSISFPSRLSLSSSSPPPSPPSQHGVKTGSSGNSDLMEGWKAVLTVIGRSGIGMKMRRTGSGLASSKGKENGSLGRSGSISFRMPCVGGTGASEEDIMDVDDQEKGVIGVDKIVDNVKKTREGSRELLRYVKDLLRRGSDSGPHPMASSASNPIIPNAMTSSPPPSTPPAAATTAS